MKRIRDASDDNDPSRSQDKRPLVSPQSESHRDEIKTVIDDAFRYLKEVKDTFHDQKDKYSMFHGILKDFKANRNDTLAIIARLKELFKGHNNLILGFKPFLPPGFETALDDEGKQS